MTKTKKLPARSKSNPKTPGTSPASSKATTSGKRRSPPGKSKSPNTKSSAARSATAPPRSPSCLSSIANSIAAAERLGTYAHLKTTEDMADSGYQRMSGRYEHVATLAAEATSFIRPEILALLR